jgi:hypothetical protein
MKRLSRIHAEPYGNVPRAGSWCKENALGRAGETFTRVDRPLRTGADRPGQPRAEAEWHHFSDTPVAIPRVTGVVGAGSCWAARPFKGTATQGTRCELRSSRVPWALEWYLLCRYGSNGCGGLGAEVIFSSGSRPEILKDAPFG